MEDFLFFFLLLSGAGLLAGLLAGVFGVGGGVIIVPVCLVVFQKMGVSSDYTMHMAVGTSLATIIPTSFMSARGHYRRGAVDVGTLKLIGGWVIFGAVLGSIVADFLSGQILRLVFAVMLLIMGGALFFSHSKKGNSEEVKQGQASSLISENREMDTKAAAKKGAGVFIGSFSAIMGIGGGSFSVPILTYFGFSIHKAIGTAAAIGMLIAIPGMFGFILMGWGVETGLPLSLGFVNFLTVLIILPATMISNPLGVKIAHHFSGPILGKIFSVLLIIVALRVMGPLLIGFF